MSDTTPHLGLPYLAASQAQKHVTVNEALRALDALVHLSVKDRDLATPPGAPAEGDRYIVAASATDEWAGHEDEVAAYLDGAWMFYAPAEGWTVWVDDEDTLITWDGSSWDGTASFSNVAKIGVNTTADDTNRLAVKSDAVLLSHDDVTPGSGDMQMKVNKAAAGNTASHLFQDAFSGRAEIGLVGDDDFVFKVSPDGSSWAEGIRIHKDTGAVSFPASAHAAAFRNLLMNGAGRINQRQATSNADDSYGHDRWYALTQTGAIAVSTVTDAEDGTPSLWRLTQSQATAQRMGYAQIVEGKNCKHLRGKAVTLSGRFRYSNAAAVRYAILEWTGTEDSVTSDVVNDWTSGTFTAGNFFNATNLTVRAVGALTPSAAALTDLTALTATLGSTFNNLIVLIWTEGTAAQNSTFDGAIQLEPGSIATTREVRPYSVELALCQRYYEKSYDPTVAPGTAVLTGMVDRRHFVAISSTVFTSDFVYFKALKRANPSVTLYDPDHAATTGYSKNGTTTAATGITTGVQLFNWFQTGYSASAGNYYRWHWTAESEL